MLAWILISSLAMKQDFPMRKMTDRIYLNVPYDRYEENPYSLAGNRSTLENANAVEIRNNEVWLVVKNKNNFKKEVDTTISLCYKENVDK